MDSHEVLEQQLLAQWGGQFVPRSYTAGFVALSYVVSLIGAISTLELLNRRTAPKGLYNNLLLLGAAITMGGISIWSMHYVGNRAIDMGDGDSHMQLAYSSGFTVLSLFVPITVLLAAFLAIGTNNKVSWVRVVSGGALAGSAICGMHYVGDASISNYACSYQVANVVASAIIAVAASIIALAVFFVFRASWTHSWWKRLGSAVLLSVAVSGMHWVASSGTRYKLTSLNNSTTQLSRNTTVIIVICLSVVACILMGGMAAYTANTMKMYAHKAQQVVLAAAVFDKNGRILVSPEGLLPVEKITDSFVEKTDQESLTEAHPLFHWMYQASRNWTSIRSLLPSMSNHLAQLPHSSRDNSRNGIKLIGDDGNVVHNYDAVFKELFCVAAAALAENTKTQLGEVGVLWDEILPTGQHKAPYRNRDHAQSIESEGLGMERKKGAPLDSPASSEDFAEKGLAGPQDAEVGRGLLMFLVRHVQSDRDVAALEAAGYRFAELYQVSNIITSGMQIKARGVERRLRQMDEQIKDETDFGPGVHLGLFGIKARIGSGGFDVLVDRQMRSRLPSVPLRLDKLEAWHSVFLSQFEGMVPMALAKTLQTAFNHLTLEEAGFATVLMRGMDSMREWFSDPLFEEALLTPTVIEVPCTMVGDVKQAHMIVFRIVIPIHYQAISPRCNYTPLALFKAQQLAQPGSPHQAAFARSVHQEIGALVKDAPPRKIKGLRRREESQEPIKPKVDAEGRPIPTRLNWADSGARSTHSDSTVKLWRGERSSNDNDQSPSSSVSVADGTWDEAALHKQKSFAGIMVSQEITVQVQDGDEPEEAGPRNSKDAMHAMRRMMSNESKSHGPVGVSSTASAGPAPKETAGTGMGIELRALRERTAALGRRPQAAHVVEVEGNKQAINFVDTLFNACIEGKPQRR